MAAGLRWTPAEAGPPAELLDQEGQAPGPVAPSVAAQGVGRPREGPVGVELAEDVVLVRPGQAGRATPGTSRSVAAGRPSWRSRPSDEMAHVGHQPDRRQRLARPSPARAATPRAGATVAGPRRTTARCSQSPCSRNRRGLVRIAEFVDVHRAPSRLAEQGGHLLAEQLDLLVRLAQVGQQAQVVAR